MGRNNAPLPPIVGDCIKMVVTIVGTDRPGLITFPYMGTAFHGTGLAADVLAFPAAFKALAEATLKACLPPTATISQYEAQAVSRNDVRNTILSNAVIGTAGATSLPANVAAVIRRGAAIKGQHGNGRVSMPYIPNTFTTVATDPNLLNAAGLAAYNAFIAAVFGTMAPVAVTVNGNNYYNALFQRPTPPSQLVTLGAPINVSYVLIETVLGTVKNRLRRRR